MDNNRLPFFDNLKFLLITAVVVGHYADAYDSYLMNSIYLFLYAFHMPLFLFISGLFHKNTRIPQKVAGYLAIYVLYKIVIFALRSAFGKSPPFLLLSEDGVPWYLFALSVFLAVTYLFRSVDKRLLLVTSVLVACFSGYDPNIGDTFVLSRCLVFYPFYLLGTMISRERILAFTEKKALKPAALLLLLLWAVLCVLKFPELRFLRRLFVARAPFAQALYPYGFLYRLLCMGMAVLLGGSCMLLVPHKSAGIITRFGQRTLQVYFWHRLTVYVLLYTGVTGWFCQTLPGKFAYILLAVLMTFLLSLKPFSFPTDTILRLTKTPSVDAD